MLRAKIQRLGIVFEVEGEKPQELIRELAFFASLPEKCSECGATVRPVYRHPQTYEFYSLVCSGSPAHELSLHVRKDASGLYVDEREGFRAVPTGGRACDDEDTGYPDEPPPAPAARREPPRPAPGQQGPAQGQTQNPRPPQGQASRYGRG